MNTGNELLKEIKDQELKNKKYFAAIINILNAYKLLKTESHGLDLFLLSISQELINKINFIDLKITEDDFNRLFNDIVNQNVTLDELEKEVNDYLHFIEEDENMDKQIKR